MACLKPSIEQLGLQTLISRLKLAKSVLTQSIMPSKFISFYPKRYICLVKIALDKLPIQRHILVLLFFVRP